MARLLILLLLSGSAQAGEWSLGGTFGSSRLDSRHHDDAAVATEPVLGVHLNWWFHRRFALEVGWVHATTGYRTENESTDRDLDAWLAGVRWMIPVGGRFFVQARGGYAKLHIDTEAPRFADGEGPMRDGADRSHYLGAGLGWRWNARWQSTLDLTRVYGDVAYGCEFGVCATTHSSYFDSVTFGIEYRFD